MPGAWTLELGPDEFVSEALLEALPTLIADPSVTAYAFPRRWVSVDGAGWHDEAPWNADGAVRLTRDAAEPGAANPGEAAAPSSAALRLPAAGALKNGRSAGSATLRHEPILTAELVGTSPEQRRRGVIEREIVERGGPGSLREARVRMQEPERFAVRAPVPLAAEDRARVVGASVGEGALAHGDALAGAAVRVVRLPRAVDPTLPARIDEPEPDPSWPIAREARPGDPADGSPIPRVIHRVWLGGAPLPEVYRAYGDTWAQLHPGWEVRLWTDEDAPRPDGLERARNLAERADLTRYEIMRRHGGVYVDTDVECLRPIDDLIAGVRAFAAYEVPGRCCNAVLGAVAGHPAFEELTRLAAIVAGHGRFPEAMGTTFPTFVLESHPDVTLFAPHRFYPDLWDGTLNEGAEPPYAHHHWAASWATDAPA